MSTRSTQLVSIQRASVDVLDMEDTFGYSQERSGNPYKHGYQCNNAWQPVDLLGGGRFQQMVQFSVVSSITL